ncbi:amidohydrolase family protein [Pseudonocardia halophobica]|uniref:amidohydrolase family protein n=1 Tax=Pseudonocardia halophobica TaxID=29401 RepID=UPI003D94A1AA
MFEACEHFDIPLGFHVPGMGRQPTGAGRQNFSAEVHPAFAVLPISMVASLIIAGVFERFPRLRIALLEWGWDWAVPFSWRLDATFGKLRDELPHLTRKLSECPSRGALRRHATTFPARTNPPRLATVTPHRPVLGNLLEQRDGPPAAARAASARPRMQERRVRAHRRSTRLAPCSAVGYGSSTTVDHCVARATV